MERDQCWAAGAKVLKRETQDEGIEQGLVRWPAHVVLDSGSTLPYNGLCGVAVEGGRQDAHVWAIGILVGYFTGSLQDGFLSAFC